VGTIPPSQLTMAILTGGQGTRLGGLEKGLLRKDGQTLVERLLGLELPRAEDLLVTDRPQPYRFVAGRARVVPDAVAAKGPASGLVAALQAARTPWVLVLPCDQPDLSAGVLEPLLEPGAEVRCYRLGGYLEPLPGLYRGELGERWRPLLEGAPGLQRLVTGVKLEALEAGPAVAVALRGVNTPEQMRALGVDGGS